MRRGRGGLVVAAALALVLTGCGVPGTPAVAEPRPDAVAVDRMVCTEPMAAASTVPGGKLPDDLEIVAVLRCIEGMTAQEDDSFAMGTTIERDEGDPDRFRAAINAPDDPKLQPACPAIVTYSPELWAETVEGHFLRLSFPVTACGQAKGDEVDAALAELDLVSEDVAPGGLSDALTTGCSTRADVIERVEDVGGANPAVLPTPALADTIGALSVCVYEREPSEPDAPGLLATTREFRTPDARAAVEQLEAAAPTTEPCSAGAATFVVVHPILERNASSAPFTVVLDGCRRAIGPDLRPVAASAELIALLTPTP